MDLLEQIGITKTPIERGYATITSQRGGGEVEAQTHTGAIVVLIGRLETGKHCFYNRRTRQIIEEAPDVTFREFGI